MNLNRQDVEKPNDTPERLPSPDPEANIEDISSVEDGGLDNGLSSGPIFIDAGLLSADSSAQFGFRYFFDDPYLITLIDQAIAGNQELKILAQDIRIASNEVLARSGAYLPFAFFGAGAVEENLQVNGRGFPDPLPDFLVATNVT